jgi:protein TonB
MSAIRQFRVPEREPSSTADQENPSAARDNPLQLLRDAIAQLKSPTGALPDQEQVANLLAEAREALEHANIVGRAISQCDAHLQEGKFEQAFEALDEGLRAYPDDATLASRRRAVEEQEKAFHSAVAVRGAIEEAKWLLDHDRTDLAAQFLKQKAAELPDQEELAIRLAELEALLPQWEQKRHVQDALARAATLEQLEQWQAALTVVEEAQQTYSGDAELGQAAERLKSLVVNDERRKKLARRIELIRQQTSARSWRRALTLLENTQIEFPGAAELKPLRREITVGLRRAECEDTVAEVRKWLVDGDLEQAVRVLQRGLEALGTETSLEAVRKELEAEKRYRDQLRQAQVLFGRRQLEQAERVLVPMLEQDRPEAQALLEAVRAARAATEEENFLEQGREKALALIQQQEFAQAADLLRNLLSLFPGNPILERDLAAAEAGLKDTVVVVQPPVAMTEEEPAAEVEPPAPPQPVGTEAAPPPGRFRRVAIAGTASLVLASGAGVVWKLSNRASAPPRRATPRPSTSTATASPAVNPPVAPPPDTEPQVLPPVSQPATPPPVVNREAKAPPKAAANTTPLRAFVPPTSTPAARNQSGAVPLPPGTDPVITVSSVPSLPAGLNPTAQGPAPPPAANPAAQPPAPKPMLPTGGKIEQAQLIRRTLPEYPNLARQRGVTGIVRLTAAIDERGEVNNVKVVSGDAVLATAAKNAVLQWKYKPATLNGRPITTTTEIQIVFGEQNK